MVWQERQNRAALFCLVSAQAAIIYMYLEDESVYVGEPRQPNSGIPQGTFLKRHKIPKDDKGGTFGVGDIEVGSTVTFYGRTFFVTSCDAFTREYLTSMGKPPAEEVPMPDEPIDAYRATLKKDTQLNPYPPAPRDDALAAYIEAAASMGHTMWCLMRHPEAAEKVRAECRAAFTAEDLRDARLSLDDVYAKLKYTEAATKEALRVVPQTAGGLRVNPTLRTLAGYDVPAGYVLTADPRVAFLDEANFPAPDRYRPERFLDTNANDPDAFFPGGMGQHRCPGISLSTLMTQIFLTYATSTFDGWSPDLEGEGSEDPEYIQVPIVIIDDKYRLKLERNWQYDL